MQLAKTGPHVIPSYIKNGFASVNQDTSLATTLGMKSGLYLNKDESSAFSMKFSTSDLPVLKNKMLGSIFETLTKGDLTMVDYAHKDFHFLRYKRMIADAGSNGEVPFQSYYENYLFNLFYFENINIAAQYDSVTGSTKNFIDNDYIPKRNLATIDVYNDNNWWAQVQSILTWKHHYDEAKWMIYSDNRPMSVEEQRLFAYNPIIMGAKGIMYDGLDNSFNEMTRLSYFKFDEVLTGFGTGYDLVNNPAIGSDFINEWHTRTNQPDEPNTSKLGSERYGGFLYKNKLNGVVADYFKNKVTMSSSVPFTTTIDYSQVESEKFKSISKILGLQYNGDNNTRIYTGMRSSRLEIMKSNLYLSRISNDLMSSKLAAWRGKGYRVLSSYDDKIFNEDPLNKIIDVSDVNTYPLVGYDFNTKQPIARSNSNGLYSEKLYQVIEEQLPNGMTKTTRTLITDSSFYDITILRKKEFSPKGNDQWKSIRNGITLCIQNRRSDPLVIDNKLSNSNETTDDPMCIRHFEKTTADKDVITKEKITFITEAEYDDRLKVVPDETDISGMQKYQHFGNMYWSKFGARMINIPFRFFTLDYSYTNILGTTNYIHNGFEVTELAGNDEVLNSNYWRNNVYDNIIKDPKFVGLMGCIARPELNIYLQPGEAKFLKVTPTFYTKYCEGPIIINPGGSLNPALVPTHLKFKPTFNDGGAIAKYNLLNIDVKSQCPANGVPISIEVLDPTVNYSFANADTSNTMYYNEFVDSLGNNRRVYSFIIDSVYNDMNDSLFYVAYTGNIKFPARFSYMTPSGDTLIAKDTIIYLGNTSLLKQTGEAVSGSELVAGQAQFTEIKTVPNPARSNFKLQFYANISKEIEVSVINNYGLETINPIKMKTSFGFNSFDIDCSNLTNGTYTLTIKDGINVFTHRLTIIK